MLGRSLLALLAFSAVLAFVLQEQWAATWVAVSCSRLAVTSWLSMKLGQWFMTCVP